MGKNEVSYCTSYVVSTWLFMNTVATVEVSYKSARLWRLLFVSLYSLLWEIDLMFSSRVSRRLVWPPARFDSTRSTRQERHPAQKRMNVLSECHLQGVHTGRRLHVDLDLAPFSPTSSMTSKLLVQ